MDITTVLLPPVVITGFLWSLDRWYLKPRRIAMGIDKVPTWLRFSAEFFPVLIAVFVLRSFLFEHYKVPSGSMIPTLQIGDYIAVNKFTYGIRLPVINTKIVDLGSPQRGDIAVFRYPKDESVNYVKRIVALPGDEIQYQNKRIKINGQELAYQPQEPYLDTENMRHAEQFVERYPKSLGGHHHIVITNPERFPFAFGSLPNPNFCQSSNGTLTCKVPAGQYFVMGDNRDNSADSRYWGFVPDKNLVGRAFFVLMNFSSLDRIGRLN